MPPSRPDTVAPPSPDGERLHPHVESVLVTEEQLRTRIAELGREIRVVYGPDEELTLISIINGALVFTADLLRELENPIRLDCIRISSYRDAVESRGVPQVLGKLTLDIAKKHVLVIDDILDTGKTLDFVTRMIRKHGPTSLRVCVLLDKKDRRTVDFEADFVGFSIPDQFVIGYGLDFAEQYRNLRYIGTLKPQFQHAS
ncbi:hypoxanthine phosphoribosyltransferase [Cephaloticoccus capnophilus]|uniref:Hypoxanthine phosphoribosyltransferase n=1 Tax=Cephaloticoccus capnophilus TaxID=1548208 RepID=A0A139SSB6_9BACT|nr:hypoxanthine phosphoribosyltransferase [Cephaloticoccus capnophilus]KXU37437.1 hypoxanthine phosphoribosyltransferase [Cephaloticoccus capnophilus]